MLRQALLWRPVNRENVHIDSPKRTPQLLVDHQSPLPANLSEGLDANIRLRKVQYLIHFRTEHLKEPVIIRPRHEKVDIVVRPEDVIILPAGKGVVEGKIASKIFRGVHYEYIVNVGKNEVICRDTKNREVGSKVSLSVEKENIQVMHKELSVNQYTDAWIDASGKLHIGEASFECDLGQLLPGAIVEDCRLTDPKSRLTYDLNDADVVAEVDLDKIDLSDDLTIGNDTGTIIASVWIGDHYRYIVRTEEEEDYVAVSPYSWNEGDQVSVTIKKEDIRLRLKNDIDTYKGKGE